MRIFMQGERWKPAAAGREINLSSSSRKPTAPHCEEHQRLCVTGWRLTKMQWAVGALWFPCWSLISQQSKMKAHQSASSETGSLGLLTSRASWFPCSCPLTWLSGSSSFCAGFLRPASPEEAPSPRTTSSPSWLMKLIYCRASSGSIRDPLQVAHLSPVRAGPL